MRVVAVKRSWCGLGLFSKFSTSQDSKKGLQRSKDEASRCRSTSLSLIFPLVARALIIEPFHMPYVRMCVCLRTPHLAYISIASHTCAPYNFASHLSPPRSAAPRSGSARSPRSSSPLSPQQLGKRSFVRLRAHSSHTLSLGRWESLLPHRRVLAVTKCCWRCWGARVTIAALLHTQPFHTHPSVSYRLST